MGGCMGPPKHAGTATTHVAQRDGQWGVGCVCVCVYGGEGYCRLPDCEASKLNTTQMTCASMQHDRVKQALGASICSSAAMML